MVAAIKIKKIIIFAIIIMLECLVQNYRNKFSVIIICSAIDDITLDGCISIFLGAKHVH